MIAVIFQFEPTLGQEEQYFDLAHALRSLLQEVDGFLSIERFESVTQKGRFVSLSFWRDEEALDQWRQLEKHRKAQSAGRDGILSQYRLSVAQIIRDYGKDDRLQAPPDSQDYHGP